MRLEALRTVAALLVVLAGCKGKATAGAELPPAGSGNVAPAEVRAPDDAGAASPRTAWELRSAPIELVCGAEPEIEGGYQDVLAAGRAAGKAKRWGLAVAAFERALAAKADDAVALDELSVALLRVGDPAAALVAGERASALATAPNARAAAHYNAGRAAEALGDVDRARAHFEQSIELRPNDTVRAQLARLGPVAPRRLEKAPVMTACQGLASLEAVCACLAKLPDLWGESTSGTGTGTCEPLSHRGAVAALVSVTSSPADPDARRPGTAIVLVAKRGATWSALRTIDLAPEVDAEVTPRGSASSEVVMYEERPMPGGTLVWVQSASKFSETAAGENEVSGDASLSLCELPADPGRAASCDLPVSLGTWNHAYALFADDDSKRCTVHTATTYRATLTSSGALSVVLVNGTDESGLVGRYQR